MSTTFYIKWIRPLAFLKSLCKMNQPGLFFQKCLLVWNTFARQLNVRIEEYDAKTQGEIRRLEDLQTCKKILLGKDCMLHGAPEPPPPFVINPEAWSFFKLLDLDQRGDVEIEQFLMGCLRHGWVQTAGDVTTKFRFLHRKKPLFRAKILLFLLF